MPYGAIDALSSERSVVLKVWNDVSSAAASPNAVVFTAARAVPTSLMDADTVEKGNASTAVPTPPTSVCAMERVDGLRSECCASVPPHPLASLADSPGRRGS